MTTVAWSHDDQFIATGGNEGRVTVWDAKSGKAVREWNPGRGRVTALAWDPTAASERLAALFKDRVIFVFDASGSHAPVEIAGRRSLAWSPDGQWLACSGLNEVDYTVSLWNTQTWKQGTASPWGIKRGGTGNLTWSPDGQTLVGSGNHPGEIVVWNRPDWNNLVLLTLPRLTTTRRGSLHRVERSLCGGVE